MKLFLLLKLFFLQALLFLEAALFSLQPFLFLSRLDCISQLRFEQNQGLISRELLSSFTQQGLRAPKIGSGDLSPDFLDPFHLGLRSLLFALSSYSSNIAVEFRLKWMKTSQDVPLRQRLVVLPVSFEFTGILSDRGYAQDQIADRAGLLLQLLLLRKSGQSLFNNRDSTLQRVRALHNC